VQINKFDFVVWVATFLAVLVLDLPTGLAVGIGWNLLTMCAQSFVVRGYNLSSANHSDLFVASNAYTKVSEIAGIKIFRYEADIFFANVANFKKQLFAQTINPQRLQLLREKAAAKAGGQGLAEDKVQLGSSDNQSQSDSGIVLTRRRKNFFVVQGAASRRH
jgi:MFS superfamily sulfate permease-like transporter